MAKTESWVFLRGLARESRHWGEFTAIFQKNFPEAEIETLDIAGNGTELSRPSFLTIEENVRDLRERSRFLREGRKLRLCSISMGSMIALKWAELYPEEIEFAVCMNTSAPGISAFYERLRPANYVHFLRFPLERDLPKRERAVLKMTARLLAEHEKLADVWAKYPQTSAANVARQLIAASRFRLGFIPFGVSVLFLAGEKDDLVNWNCTRRLAEKTKRPLRSHAEAGHDLPLDVPDWVCEQIRAFAPEITGRPGSE